MLTDRDKIYVSDRLNDKSSVSSPSFQGIIIDTAITATAILSHKTDTKNQQCDTGLEGDHLNLITNCVHQMRRL